jgi:16S rRNA (guanine527-N7)-methyltransferase
MSAHDIPGLLAASQQLGVALQTQQAERLLAYMTLLEKWNRVHNLTAVRAPEKMVTHHLLDSLSVVPYLIQESRVLDVGSGGGLPGIPLAIVQPEVRVTLLDSNHKKTSFLQQAMIELALNNVDVVTARVEQYAPNGHGKSPPQMMKQRFAMPVSPHSLLSPLSGERDEVSLREFHAKGQYTGIICRAFAEMAEVIRLTQTLLAPAGRWYMMKGVYPEAELAKLPAGVVVKAIHELKVPNLAASRHLLVLERVDG